MNERKRLIKLLQNAPLDCTGCRGVGTIADYLIKNGITFRNNKIIEHQFTGRRYVKVTGKCPICEDCPDNCPLKDK